MSRGLPRAIWLLGLTAAWASIASAQPVPPMVVGAAPAAPTTAPDSQPKAAATVEAPAFERRAIDAGKSGPAKAAPDGTSKGKLNDWLGSTFWATAAVLGLILLGAYAVKRWGPASLNTRGGGPFRVLSRWHFSTRQYVTLIRFGRRVLLLGVTGQQISLLAEVTDPAEVEQLLSTCPAGRSILAEGFGQLLGRQRTQMADEPADGAGASPSPATGAALGHLGQVIGQVKSRLSKFKAGDEK